MASETENRGRAGEAAAGRKRASVSGRAAWHGERRRRRSAPLVEGGVKRRGARREPVTPAGGAAGSRGIGLADGSDWWLDPRAPAQVAFASPPRASGRGSPAEPAGRALEPGRRERMASIDAAWLRMDRATNPLVVNILLWYEQPVDWPAVRAIVGEQIVARFARFRQRVVDDRLGRPCWQHDPRFELDLHLHRLALPAPGDGRALQRLVGDLVSAPLDRRKPLWDMYLVDGYGQGCALLVRVHHCIADGITLARALGPLVGVSSGAGFAPPAADGAGPLGGLPLAGALSSGWQGAAALLRAAVGSAAHPGRLAAAAGEGGADVDALARLLAGRPDAAGPLKRQPAAGQRVAWTRPVPLAELKRTARQADATVNDLLVAALSGALGHYLRSRGPDVDELHALMPVNLRPPGEPLPRELGNRFGLLIVGLPVGIRSQRRRLAEVKRRLDALKRSQQAPVSYAILAALGQTPARLEARAIDFFTAKATLVLTNVAGPPTPLQTAATEVAGVLVWAPCSGSVGVSATILSYSGQVNIGVLADRSLVPDPDRLAAHIEKELQRLTAS